MLLAIALWLILPTLAAASPPDPTWMAGLYDDADFDDVVIHIGLLAGVCDALPPPCLAFDSHVRHLTPSGWHPPARRSQAPLRGRAPPLL